MCTQWLPCDKPEQELIAFTYNEETDTLYFVAKDRSIYRRTSYGESLPDRWAYLDVEV